MKSSNMVQTRENEFFTYSFTLKKCPSHPDTSSVFGKFSRNFDHSFNSTSVRNTLKQFKQKKTKSFNINSVNESRANVWKALIGNSLYITPKLFEIFKVKGQKLRQSISSGMCLYGQESSIGLIELDIPRTSFPQNEFLIECNFCDTSILHNRMREVLEAYVCYRPDVGYVQGMTFLCWILLSTGLDVYDAFVCFCNLLHRPILRKFYALRGVEVNSILSLFDELFIEILPDLYSFFESIGITTEMYVFSLIEVIYMNGYSHFFQKYCL